jgi:hypothetical protein
LLCGVPLANTIMWSLLNASFVLCICCLQSRTFPCSGFPNPFSQWTHGQL